MEPNTRSVKMKLEKLSKIALSILVILSAVATADKHSEGTDSLVNYIRESYKTASLSAELDTLIHRYLTQRHSDSNKINYYDTWNGIFQSTVNDAKKRHPNAKYLDDSIFNRIIILEFAGRKYGKFLNDGGLISWMQDFGLNISPIMLGRVNKPASLREHIWKNCQKPDIAMFTFICRAFGAPDSLPDMSPYNTSIYRAISGDTSAERMIFDSISRLTEPKALSSAMQLLGYIGSKKAMQKTLEYFPDTTYIAETVFAGRTNTEIIQKTSLRKAIIEALAYNNPDTVPEIFLHNYTGSDNWYQLVTDTTDEKIKLKIQEICWFKYSHHCFRNGSYYPTRLVNDLQQVADWASRRYDCKVKMPTSDYKVNPLICLGGSLR
jgi:hypothetical protein